jgi:PTS system mannose-specific IIC component
MIYLFLILLTGIISIDRNNALNLMISRPIVISLIFYLFVENSSVIILTGILYELYGVIDIPVGTHIPKDDSFATYCSSIAIAFGSVNNSLNFLLMVLLSLVLMYFATLAEGYTRKINRVLYNKVENHITFKPNYLISLGIAISFLKGIVVYNLGAILLIILLNFVSLEADYNIGLYACILITVATAYFIDYFEIFGYKKYFFLLCGFLIGWLIV